MSLINQARLAKYLDLELNVLLSGHAGTGKTSIIKQVFENAGLRWKYFSASTLDPWVDLIGVPQGVTDPRNPNEKVLELIRPDYMKYNEIDALFFDELNRAPEKVLNAVMELIQFKSINGHKLPNLKVIWAAINPSDDGLYNVNILDPAQRDRFQVQIDVPYRVDEEYFFEKHPLNGRAFVSWWNAIPIDIRMSVSPRRLDYAATAFANGCVLSDFLPHQSNPAALRKLLKNVPWNQQLAEIETEEQAKVFFSDVNNVTKLLEQIQEKNKQALEFYKTYKEIMPLDLVEALSPEVKAVETGIPVIKNFEELLNACSRWKKGAPELTAFLNTFDITKLYQQGGSIREDVLMCVRVKQPAFIKLMDHIKLILTKGGEPTMKAALKVGDDPSNISRIVMWVSQHDTQFTVLDKEERKKINGRVYSHKIIENMHWL